MVGRSHEHAAAMIAFSRRGLSARLEVRWRCEAPSVISETLCPAPLRLLASPGERLSAKGRPLTNHKSLHRDCTRGGHAN